MHRAFMSGVSSLSLEPGGTVHGASIALFVGVLGTFTRQRKGTRELSLEETLRVLGDRSTRRIVALQSPPAPVAEPFVGSYKRTRRMRALRFKALSLAELTEPVERVTLVNPEPSIQREGMATVKIDRLRIRRERRHRRLMIAALVIALLVLWLIT